MQNERGVLCVLEAHHQTRGGREAMDSASTSLQSHQLLGGCEFEVFLSFRGTDARTGFVDYLYNDLIDVGIRAFRDNEELRVGEEIGSNLLEGIRSSKIAIPIFSQNYANSKWCLLELVEMVKCRKTAGQLILPVFYDAEPGDVRHQTGSYGDAFKEHIKQFSEETLSQWRQALKEVGALKGWELKNIANGHEGSLVKEIVIKVWRELKKNYAVVASESLVGMDHHETEMAKLLSVDSNDVRIVGIHGMGGMGKSTIAKVIYNKLVERFDRCCFLADVRETSKQKGLVDLQNQLISTILNHKHLGVRSVDEGSIVIRDTFCTKKALIVLDDVDQMEQLAAFAQNRSWFGVGSRIIVTTRNKDILNVPQVDWTYEPKEMDMNLALELFSKHAFRTNHPPKEFAELSESVASSAAGLPLALEIIGSFLCGKKKDVWKYTLKKLKHIPHDKVQEKLRLSYDALGHEQKQIFLDIACFCGGVDRRIVSHMWDDCDFYPENNIEVLRFMSLVKVENDELRMHDQLRDLGREIVRQENISRPEKRSRLWSPEQALHVLKTQQGTKNVEALCIDGRETCPEYLTDAEFARMSNLRYLEVDYAILKGDFNRLLLNLRCLSWVGAPERFTLLNFHLRNLTILNLSYGKFSNDWGGWKLLQVAKKLKVLSVPHCLKITTSPDLSANVELEQLNLEGCQSLVSFHPSIWNLRGLQILGISRTSITELPKSIGMLKKLEELHAFDCANLKGEVPSELGLLKCLRVLILSSSMICRLPTSMHLLRQLQCLSLMDSTELESLPELPPGLVRLWATFKSMQTCSHLSKLVKLEVLVLSNCHELLEIPEEMGGLSQLKELRLRFCDKLQHIGTLPSSLVTIELHDCPHLVELKGLENLELLQSLKISYCRKLSYLDGLEKLRSLLSLVLESCSSIVRLGVMSNLKQLQYIVIEHCNKLKLIRGLDELKALIGVGLGGCTSSLFLSMLQQVSQVKNLKTFICETTDHTGHAEILEILENVEGPCRVSGHLSRTQPDQNSMTHVINFERNPIMDFSVNDVTGPRLACQNQDGAMVHYLFRDVVPDHGVDREFQYIHPDRNFVFTLLYEGKQFGNSFSDYLSVNYKCFSQIHNICECALFSLTIKEEKNIDLAVYRSDSEFRPKIREVKTISSQAK